MNGLVIGLGNTARGDDAVGIEVARKVAEIAPSGIRVVETDDPASLLEAWESSDRVVVVDAMFSNRPAGTAVAFDVRKTGLPAGSWAAGGTHAMGLATVVELGRVLGRLPRHLVVVGVEAESTAPSQGTTTNVADATSTAVRLVLDCLGPGGR
jgi:hydrogenase maturation protease